jgi:P27 family predicted phage terminase small subunit
MRRHPKPTYLKVLDGTRESRINRSEPSPGDAADVTPPGYLNDAALEVWNRLAPDLMEKGCLSFWDVDLFAAYCDAIAVYRDCRAKIAGDYVVKGSVPGTAVKNALWRVALDALDVANRIGARFGLTPSDRAKIDVTTVEKKPTTGPERLLS